MEAPEWLGTVSFDLRGGPAQGRKVAEAINRCYKLGASGYAYHKDGKFFQALSSFPGILCDRLGYVRFETEEAWQKALDRGYLTLSKRKDGRVVVNVRRVRDLSRLPGYTRYPDDREVY